MAKITSNTQIDTINILTEVNSANDTDLIMLQRGLVSHKMKKQNLIIPISQIAPINNNKVLGNVSGSSAAPSEVDLDIDISGTFAQHNSVASSKSIKAYIDGELSKDNVYYVDLQGVYEDTTKYINGVEPEAKIKNEAKLIYPNLNEGDRVLVSFGTWYYDRMGNGTSAWRNTSGGKAMASYKVNSDGTWTWVKNMAI